MAAKEKRGVNSKLDELRSRLGLPVAMYDEEILALQLAETRSSIPILAVFHFVAVLAYFDFTFTSIPMHLLGPWMILGSLIGAVLMGVYFLLGRKSIVAGGGRLISRLAPLLALVISIYWTWASAYQAQTLPNQLYDAAKMLALATLFVGAMVSIRFPASAMVFILGVVAIGLYHIATALSPHSPIPYIFGVLCVASFGAVVVLLSRTLFRRVQLEKLLSRDGEVIKMLLNNLGDEGGDLLWETDATGRLKDYSPRLADILGFAEQDRDRDGFGYQIFCRWAPQLDERFAAREILRNERIEVERQGEKSFWQISAQPREDDLGHFTGYLGVARDITAQYLQENRLAAARDTAQQAADSKSQFLAVISHELRTPINAIVGFSEVLSAGQGEHLSVSARREYLGTILESAKHLQGLINEILESTRIERGTIQLDDQPNDAAELVEVVARIVRDQATQSKISVVARVVEDVEVMGDLTRLKQVILNILSNAIKFSPEGGVVNVDMLRERDGDLVITVRDAGIGISDVDAERVFEPFVQAEAGSNRRFGGMGLGLSIARRIARLHGGELTLKGLEGGGTEARFTLPSARVRWPKARAKRDGKTAAA